MSGNVIPFEERADRFQGYREPARRVMERFASLVNANPAPYTAMAEAARKSFNLVFWNEEKKCLFDVVQGSKKDGAIRPNQIFSVSPLFDLLPPELLRKGRFDELFFIDLPAAPEREEILRIHVARRRRDPAAYDLAALARAAAGFSGAELEQAVVAALHEAFAEQAELSQAHLARAVAESLPLSVTMREEIDRLRDWAATRTRAASAARPEPVPSAPRA